MQVWNALHVARCKYRTQKSRQKSPSEHYRTNLSGYVSATKARIDNRKKTLLNTDTSPTCPHNMVNLRPANGWDLLASLGHPCKFQRLSRLGRVTARHCSSGHHPNFAALNRAPPIFGRATITLGIGPHSSFSYFRAVQHLLSLISAWKCHWMYIVTCKAPHNFAISY